MKAEQLRKSILQMAIQGKLVPQDPTDEPASVLLEKIRAEKQKLIKEGKIKKDKFDSVIFRGDDNRYYEKVGNEVKDITEEIDFDLPVGWSFARINSLLYIQTGASFKKEQASNDKTKIRILRGGNITQNGYSFFDNDIFIDRILVANNILLRKNDLITPAVTSLDNIGKLALIECDYDNVSAGGFVFICRPYFAINTLAKFLLIALQSPFFNSQMKSITKKSGQAFYNVGKERLIQLVIPIPPIAEQERIVSEMERYEPLLSEYDKLEQQKSKLDDEIYDKLKKSILQYAIQGKLVPQNTNDEPASILLERIRAEKKAQLGKKYVDSYIYKGDDNCYYEKIVASVKNISDEISFDVPKNWVWTRLADICDYIHRGKSPTYGTTKQLPIIAQKCNQWDKIHIEKCLYADEKTIKNYTQEQYLSIGDILINSTGTGTVGRTGLIDAYIFQQHPSFVVDSHVTVVRANALLLSKYLYLFLISPQIQTDVEARCSGSTNQIELATSTIRNYLVPVPPLQEQRRIIEKYNMIMSNLKGEN